MALGMINILNNSKIDEEIKTLGEEVSAIKNPEFTQAETRENIASGEALDVIMGKLNKIISEIKEYAYNEPVNNLTTTTTGKPLDAYQGKVLNDKISSASGGVCYVDPSGYNTVPLSTTTNKYSNLPTYFYNGSAVVYNNEIHILGGNGDYKGHYKWNGSSWSSVGTLPYQFTYGSAVVYNNEIHILSSGNNSAYYKYHYKWDGSSWTSVSTLPYPFYQGSAVVYKNEIHILGSGYDGCYTYHYKWNGSSWSKVSTLPYRFSNGSAVVYNNEIHILGSDNSACQTYHYKWNGTSWSSVSTLPYQFYFGSAVVYNNEIHILGSNIGIYNTCHYKWNGFIWTIVSTLLYSFYFGSAVVYNNEIHILGGHGGSKDKETFKQVVYNYRIRISSKVTITGGSELKIYNSSGAVQSSTISTSGIYYIYATEPFVIK